MQPTYQFNFALLLGGVFATLSLTVMTWLTVGPVIAFTQLDNQPIVALESRLQEIDQQLSKLPHYSLRSGVGAIGFRSETHLDAEHQEWLKIDFGGGVFNRRNCFGSQPLARTCLRISCGRVP